MDKSGTDQHKQRSVEELKQALTDDPTSFIYATISENDLLRELAKSNYQKFLVCLCFAVVLLFSAWAGWARDEKIRYFYQDSQGNFHEVNVTDRPAHYRHRALKLAERVAEGMHSWRYRRSQTNGGVEKDGIRDSFNALFELCNGDVIEQYYNDLGTKGVFSAAEQYKQTYFGQVLRKAITHSKTLPNGMATWRINLLLREEIEGTTRPVISEYDIVIDVEQVPISTTPSGLRCVRYDENKR